ncbi:MAG: (Fe-S)-binding protein [Halobacteriaceae archaeon]
MTVPLQTRPTFWHVGHVGEALFYYLAAVAVAIFALGVYGRVRRYARGAADPTARLDDVGRRVLRAARLLVTNEAQLDRDRFAGVMHAFVVWGFLTLFVGTTILAVDMDLYRPLAGTSFFVGRFYLSYSLVMDALGLLFVVGVGMALYRRYWVRDDRLHGPHTSVEDDLFVWTLFVLGVGGYLLEGVRILAQGFPAYETVSAVGWTVAVGLAGLGLDPATAAAAYAPLWWAHALVALAFVASVPYAKPFHMLSAFANVVTRDPDAGRSLPGVPADAAPEDIGHGGLEDFSWKQLLDHDACTNCGRCSSVCPANAAGRPLDPREVILDLKDYRERRDAGGETVPVVADGGESVVATETLSSCVACMACMDACPVDVEHVTQFTQMNRRLVEAGAMESNVGDVLMDLFRHGNAFGEPGRTRPAWTEDLEFEVPDAREQSVEYLWYVGDYPSYDRRNQRMARAIARLFEAAGVDYGILYEDERNDGNDVRRVGEEGLFEMLAEENAETFAACEFDAVVCSDPHAFNTFRNEYDAVGFDRPVYHYTQVLADLLDGGRFDLGGEELDVTVTYHDPCHLGRYNGVFDPPRRVVEATGATLAEMPRNRSDSFCCGGGGGGAWTEFDDDPKPSEQRLREAVEDTAGEVDRFVVACPTCTTMYEDGRKTGGFEDALEVTDVAELLWEAVDARDGAARTGEAGVSAD